MTFEKIVMALEQSGREIIHQRYRLDCCVDAAGILLDVFDYFHVQARPVCCSLNVLNRAAMTFVDEHGIPAPDDADGVKRWRDLQCRWISVGHGLGPKNDGGYDGHVVIIAQGDVPTLIDLTLDQVGQVDGEILPPLFAEFAPEEDFLAFEFENGRVEYNFDLLRDDFKRTRAWHHSKQRSPTVATLIRATKSLCWTIDG